MLPTAYNVSNGFKYTAIFYDPCTLLTDILVVQAEPFIYHYYSWLPNIATETRQDYKFKRYNELMKVGLQSSVVVIPYPTCARDEIERIEARLHVLPKVNVLMIQDVGLRVHIVETLG